MIEQAHVCLGHMSEDVTRKTAKALNLILTKGTLKPCDACAAAKAKQKKERSQNEQYDAFQYKKGRESNLFGHCDHQSS
jgi:hypothetical protein